MMVGLSAPSSPAQAGRGLVLAGGGVWWKYVQRLRQEVLADEGITD